MNKDDILKEAKQRYPSGTHIKGLPYAYEPKKNSGTVDWENSKNYKWDSVHFSENRLFLGMEEEKGAYRILIYDNGKWAESSISDKLKQAREIIYKD